MSKEIKIYNPNSDSFFTRFSEVISKKTPRQFIKKHPFNGFDYIEVGYMRRALLGAVEKLGLTIKMTADQIMPWDVIMKAKQITVKVRLEIIDPRSGDIIASTENFGGSEIKCYKADNPKKERQNMPMDISNDYKAATAEGFKKCCSFFGIGQDIYEPKVEACLEKTKAEHGSK